MKMAEDKVTRIARQIYEEIGGPENVQSLVHCMTRVRLSMIDETKVNPSNSTKKFDYYFFVFWHKHLLY